MGRLLEDIAGEWLYIDSRIERASQEVFEGLPTRFVRESDVCVAATQFEKLQQGAKNVEQHS